MVMQSAFSSHVWVHMKVSLLGKSDGCAEKFALQPIALQTLMMQIFAVRHAPQLLRLHVCNGQWKFSVMKFLII
jgi:hypothetical protein